MMDDAFANAMFELAKKRGRISPTGLIMGNHGKCISRKKVILMHQKCGRRCEQATTADFEECGIQPCARRLFKYLAKQVYTRHWINGL